MKKDVRGWASFSEEAEELYVACVVLYRCARAERLELVAFVLIEMKQSGFIFTFEVDDTTAYHTLNIFQCIHYTFHNLISAWDV